MIIFLSMCFQFWKHHRSLGVKSLRQKIWLVKKFPKRTHLCKYVVQATIIVLFIIISGKIFDYRSRRQYLFQNRHQQTTDCNLSICLRTPFLRTYSEDTTFNDINPKTVSWPWIFDADEMYDFGVRSGGFKTRDGSLPLRHLFRTVQSTVVLFIPFEHSNM